MNESRAEHGPPSTFDAWSVVIVQWIKDLPVMEQQTLFASWLLRRRRDAGTKLEELFHADGIGRFSERVRALARHLGGEFRENEHVLLSQLYIYMAGIIPESIRNETRELVQTALGGPAGR